MNIHQAIRAVMAELPAIGKDERNQQQGYRFRGIEAIMAALHDVLAKHGVHYAPTVLERLTETRPTGKGGTLYVVHLHVRYTFFGPDGDSFECSVWGEGSDSGDKATNKAMTAAMKYMLTQVFAIAGESHDGDREAPEPARSTSPAAKSKARKAKPAPAPAPDPRAELIAEVRDLTMKMHSGDVDAAKAFLALNMADNWSGRLDDATDEQLEAVRKILVDVNPFD